MITDGCDTEILLERIRERDQEIEKLRSQLSQQSYGNGDESYQREPLGQLRSENVLRHEEYKRYGRQMILPQIGLKGQIKLKNATVLLVGLGGLGCPAAAYLAGAGVGTIGLMDGDVVDTSNLHRQILHTTARVGMLKVESAFLYLRQLNPLIQYQLHRQHLSSTSAVQEFRKYDLVLDCTDHPMSRYLVSDAAVCAGVPCISAAALRTDGQLYVLNYPPFREDKDLNYASGPCYRCVHPKPPPAESLVTCGEGGILGPVVGVMGILMATEAIKILTSRMEPETMSLNHLASQKGRDNISNDTVEGEQQILNFSPFMLIYSAFANPPFRSIRLRGRRKNCLACSSDPMLRCITVESLISGTVDYAAFCGQLSPVSLLPLSARMKPEQLALSQKDKRIQNEILLDVRDETQFQICSMPGSFNIPVQEVRDRVTEILEEVDKADVTRLIVICRNGNDSQIAAHELQGLIGDRFKGLWIGDLLGGLEAWRKDIDPTFPDY